MKTKIIKTDQEYNEVCNRIYNLIHSTDESLKPDSPEGEELELLSLLVENYEHEHYPVDFPDPIEAIKFRMDQLNLKQVDIAPLFGGITRASEVLNRKRSLTLKMISLLNKYLEIPFESLIQGKKEYFLEPDKQVRLLQVSAINENLKKHKRIHVS